jgi:hypothetical protein
MIIITLWVIEKRIQEVRLGRDLEKAADQANRDFEKTKQEWDRMEKEVERTFGKMPGQQPPSLPQPSKRSSEWGSGR